MTVFCEGCQVPGLCKRNGCAERFLDWNTVQLDDPRLRLPRGRLLVVEDGREVEIPKREVSSG